MIFPERCCFIIGATALHEYTVPNRFISVTSCKSAGSRVLALVSMGRPRPPPAIRDEHIHPTPLLDDPRNHCLDRLMIPDINLDAHGSATRRLDLADRAVGGHVLGLDLEFLMRVQVQVGDRDPSHPIWRGAWRKPVRDHAPPPSRLPPSRPACPSSASDMVRYAICYP
jgi:hypothetical protein